MPLKLGVIGIDHGHIFGMLGNMKAQGCHCAEYWTDGPAVTESKFAEVFPELKKADDRRRILDDPDVSMVLISAVPADRAQFAIEAMAAGKDVMVDKPGCTTLEQLTEIRETQARTGRIWTINFSERFEVPAVTRAEELVFGGAIGRVVQTVGLGPHKKNLKTRPPWYFERERFGGRAAKVTIGDAQIIDIAEARDKARKILVQAQNGEGPRLDRAHARTEAGRTLRSVIDLYLKHRAAERMKPRTLVEAKRALLKRWALFHDVAISKVTTSMIAARLLELKEQHGPIAANHARTYLSTCMNWAEKQGFIEINPVTRTEAPGKKRIRYRVLSLEELRAIWASTESNGDFDVIVRLLMLTAARRQEVAGMLRSEIDLENSVWKLGRERAKKETEREFPLPRQATALLADRHPICGRDFVFGQGSGPFSGFTRAKQRLDKRSGVSNWILHDLRRTWDTHAQDEIGVEPHIADEVMGHIGHHRSGARRHYNHARYRVPKQLALQRYADWVIPKHLHVSVDRDSQSVTT